MIAKVSIDRKVSSLANLYDYNVPANLIDKIQVGDSVFVPFGRDQVFGYVIELDNDSSKDLKDIIDIVNNKNQIGDVNFKLAKMLASDLDCTIGNVLGMMEPSFLKGQKQQYLYIQDYNKLDANLAVFLNGKTKIQISDDLQDYSKLIQNEIKNGNIIKGYEFFVYGKNKKVKLYSVIDDVKQPTKSRELVVRFLSLHPSSSMEEIKVATDVSEAVVKALVANKTLKVEEVIISNKEKGELKNLSKYEFSFSEKEILDYYHNTNGNKPYLLISNNEEFNLHFYLRIIEDAISENKKVVLVYPNALSINEASILFKRYYKGLDVVTYHSRNSNGDNYDTFNKILNGDYHLLITTPQGLLLNLNDVKTFILEDSGDEMYINETYPYISYKEASIKKAKLLSSNIILSSISPTVSDYYNASIGKYDLLNNNNVISANTKIVDMNKEVLETNDMVISSALKEAIDKTISENKISLLICNNVAFATQIKCRKCGKVLKCPHCKVPLVYIKSKDIAKCNYCNYEEKMFRSCKCGSTNYISLGFGLEQVKERIDKLYPDKKVVMANSAFLNNNNKMDNLIQDIMDKNVDVIIGTNALTKLENYDNISLVGLLYVDSFLNMNNYLGSEYTYSVISKATKFGKLIIQTYNPDHYSIINAITNDYEGFYDLEINNRELLDYPPFKELSVLVSKGDYQEMFHFGYYFKKATSHNSDIIVLGPIYDYQLKGVKLVIKHNDNEKLVKIINDCIKHFDNPKVIVSYHRFTRGG